MVTHTHRFLSIAESEVGVGNDFSLELMSQNLGTNRRRIYDIINVLEALEMIVKQSKNWYTWLGKENLLLTLAKMRVCIWREREREMEGREGEVTKEGECQYIIVPIGNGPR